jgi:hypothetical protein
MAFVLLTVCSGPSARAQLLDQLIAPDRPGTARESGVTVASRQRPDYDALGVRLGNVTIRPELRESLGYDDNVTGTRRAQGSPIVETDARVRADYEDSQATLSSRLSVDDVRTTSKQAQSYTNWAAGLGGTLRFGRDIASVSFDHQTLTQTLRDLDVPQLDRGIAYRVDTLRASYRAEFNRVFVQPGLSAGLYDYDNGTVAGARYQQAYRNRVVVTPSVIVGYELQPNRNLVLVVRDAVGRYRSAMPPAAKRDFNDISVLAGIDYDADGLWRYRLLVGYESRDFSSRQYKTIAAPVVEAAVIWNPTGLTTVTATATRHIQDSADETAVGFTETAIGVRVDHELLRNILLQANATYLMDDYKQNQGSQSLIRAGVGATWLINRNAQLVASYDRIQRQRGGVSQVQAGGLQVSRTGFTENLVLLTLRLAL